MKSLTLFSSLGSLLLPFLAHAQTFTLDYLFGRAATLINQAILVMVGLGVVVFFWGVIQYVIAQGDQKKLAEGRQYMLYGIVGLTVMVSVCGIVNLLLITIFGGTS